MKSLSDALLDLAARVSELESSAAATLTDNREALEVRRREIEKALDTDALETAGSETVAAAQRWWADTRESVDRQVERMRREFGTWGKERALDSAELTAQLAEQEARLAIDVASRVVRARSTQPWRRTSRAPRSAARPARSDAGRAARFRALLTRPYAAGRGPSHAPRATVGWKARWAAYGVWRVGSRTHRFLAGGPGSAVWQQRSWRPRSELLAEEARPAVGRGGFNPAMTARMPATAHAHRRRCHLPVATAHRTGGRPARHAVHHLDPSA